jgi:trans-aconitate methyltransferase
MTFNPNQLLNNPANLINIRGAGGTVPGGLANKVPADPQRQPPPEKEALPPPEYDRGIYRDAYGRLGLLSVANVCDLGCGNGNFAGVMVERNQRPEVYLGVDMSHSKIKTAKGAYPGWSFLYGDFNSREIREKYERFEAYLLLHVMDVLEDDLAFLDTVPQGKHLVFSLPRFEKEGSKRFFPDLSSLREHYSSLIRITAVGRFKSPEGVYSMVQAIRW